MPLYDYACCECDYSFEAMNTIANRHSTACPQCGGTSLQEVSAPMVKLDGTDPSFPGAWIKWDKKRKQKIAQERKLLDN